jgi:DNA-binding NtrC family response regulator
LGERYRCEFAASLDQARRKLAGGDFQLALCDLEMLGESGFDLAEEISEEHPDTALVLITDTDDPELARKAFGLGSLTVIVGPRSAAGVRPGRLVLGKATG